MIRKIKYKKLIEAVEHFHAVCQEKLITVRFSIEPDGLYSINLTRSFRPQKFINDNISWELCIRPKLDAHNWSKKKIYWADKKIYAKYKQMVANIVKKFNRKNSPAHLIQVDVSEELATITKDIEISVKMLIHTCENNQYINKEEEKFLHIRDFIKELQSQLDYFHLLLLIPSEDLDRVKEISHIIDKINEIFEYIFASVEFSNNSMNLKSLNSSISISTPLPKKLIVKRETIITMLYALFTLK